MINGSHSIIYSKNADADRNFLRDVLGLPNVDVGGGWLIFGLPPSEVAVHPGENNDHHELYLLCENVEAFVAEMTKRGIACSPISNQGWGVLTQVTLPGGGKIGVYEPRHARPPVVGAPAPAAAKKAAPRRLPRKPARAKKAARRAPKSKGRR